MKLSNRIRLLSASLLILSLLPACGNQSLSSVSPAGPSARALRGGTFTASYTGTFSGSCRGSKGGAFKFDGTGSATFLHRSVESKMFQMAKGCRQSLGGTGLLTSKRNPSNSIGVSFSGSLIGCTWARFAVTGGTGEFTHVAGSGTVTTDCKPSGQYSDMWNGTITF